DAGIVERVPKPSGRGHEYCLSAAGEELQPVILHLGEWGRRWVSARVSKDKLDAGFLMWDIHRRIDTNALPERRVIVQFDLHGLPRGARGMQRWWLVLHRPEVDLCLKDPGGEADLWLAADLHALTRVWVGELSLKDALRRQLIVLCGPSPLVKAFPGWLMLGVFAGHSGHARPDGA
ncbi:MAG TPA: winged helix-turn-helix transcriptional regulator, partial [Burkholderiales bacterium]|nr:winged helix-turn-helix transcriptional regulator [Burkholderiales bacterium]